MGCDGEKVKPSSAVLRALHCDSLADAWFAAFVNREKPTKIDQHDKERSDAELARDVLCDPRNRGIRNEKGEITHTRTNWKPDPTGLGFAIVPDVDAHRPYLYKIN